MRFNFRLRFDLVEGSHLNSNDELVRLDSSLSGELLTICSAARGTPISSHSSVAIIGGAYGSYDVALETAEQLRDSLLVWAVKNRFGIDIGDGCVRSILTDAGKTYFERQLGKPVRGDLQGIDVYPAEGDTVFVRAEADVSIGKSIEGFIANLREIRSLSWHLTEKQRIAAELFSASFFDRVFRSRFITLVTAVEALLEPARRCIEVQTIIDQARASAEALSKANPARQSLISGLERLREESIGQAGRQLADCLLKDKSYDDMPPGRFFARCYTIRSQTVHNGVPEDPSVDFLTLGNSCQQFVGDLLLASFEAAKSPVFSLNPQKLASN
ncbi:MAG: hypothetical protein ACD_75C00141G0002 [uncultured bacterium]|nr:MAG: hypothetical protein ACD_75C00141G0002 [uncultured bacterium]